MKTTFDLHLEKERTCVTLVEEGFVCVPLAWPVSANVLIMTTV